MEHRTPLRPLGVGEILDVAINIVLKNWRVLLKAVVVVVIPIQLLSIAVLTATLSDPDLINNRSTFTGSDSDLDVTGSDIASLAVGYGLVGLLGLVLGAFATAACFKAVSDAYLGAKPDWRESLAFARGHIWSVLLVTVLVALGAVLAMIPLVIPGIWLYISWAVAVPALLSERLKRTKALGRSYRLVKGRWWKTFGTLLVGFILAGVAGGIVSALVSALALTDLGDSVFGAAVVNGVSSGLSQLITLPVTVSIVAVVYYDLQVRKDGVDLETLAGRLGIAPDHANLPRAAQPVTGWQAPGGPAPTAPGWQSPPQPAGWSGPPPTAPGWQSAPAQPWLGAGGWNQPQQPSPPDPGPPPPPAGPAPPESGGGGGWAPPRPPGGSKPAEGDREADDR